MRELKIFLFTIIVGGLGLLFLNNNKVNASENLSQESYSNYYENSDLVYEMSDLSNITPYLYNNEEVLIDDYKDKLYRSTLVKETDNTNHDYYNILDDDPIVNIIPKELFTKEIDVVIVDGDEYTYTIKTEPVRDINDGFIYYISHVMVLDIDSNIENYSFNVTNDLIETTVTKLFEYKYVTLSKENDYSAPTFLRNQILDHNDDGVLEFSPYARVDNSFNDDYIVFPYFEVLPFTFREVNEWTIGNISFLANIMNANTLNQSDDNYNCQLDDGCFFTGNRVECETCEREIENYEEEYNEIIFKEAASIVEEITDVILDKYVPVVSTTKEIFSKGISIAHSICNIISHLDNTNIVYTEYDTTESFTSGTNYSYATTESQLKNYGNLLKTAFLYLEPPLTLNGNYVKSMYHYAYEKENIPAVFTEVISYDINVDGNSYNVVHSNIKNIGLKEVNTSTTNYISGEYNMLGCATAYNITPQYSQNYSINCGENDVIIYDVNQNIVSTSKNCYLEKNKTYSIYVINNSDESIIYDFFMSGYDISESARLDSLESAQYTFISDINGVRCITSNYDIEDMDLMYFNEGNVYQIIITNNTNISGIAYLSIEEIPDATFDSKGHISNDCKYVRFNETKGIYKIEYNSVYKYFVVVDKTLKERTAAFVKYNAKDEIYFITSYIDAIRLANYDYNIVFNGNVVEDNSENYTINSVNYLNLKSTSQSDFSVQIEDAIYDTAEDHFNPYDNSLEFKEYGYHCVLIKYYLIEGGNILSSEEARISIYFLPNYSRVYIKNISFDKGEKRYEFSFDGALKYIDFEMVANGNIIKYSIDSIKDFDAKFVYDENTLCYTFHFHLIYLSDNEVLNNIPFVCSNVNYPGCIMKELEDFYIEARTSYFDITQDDYGIVYGISRFEQLKMAFNIYSYGSFSYSDYVNDDIEIYGDINDLRFKLLNDIACLNQIVITRRIIFNGEFDGQNHIISGLNVMIDYETNSGGIFAANYGFIHQVSFVDPKMSFTYAFRKWNLNIGLLTANNYGTIEEVSITGGSCSYSIYTVDRYGHYTFTRYNDVELSTSVIFG